MAKARPTDDPTSEQLFAAVDCYADTERKRLRNPDAQPAAAPLRAIGPLAEHVRHLLSPARPGVPLPVGDLTDLPFQLIRPLGAGRTGLVWLARNTRYRTGTSDAASGREVALKVYRTDFDGWEEYARNECAMMERIEDRDHVVTFFHAHPLTAAPRILVTEYADGGDLRSHLNRTHGIPALSARVAVLVEVARGLAAVHTRDVRHGDLKPENVFLRERGNRRWMLGDFGLAEDLTGDGWRARREAVDGTRAYQALELLQLPLAPQPTRRWGSAADVFSFGVVMFECLSGGLPHNPADYRTLDEYCRAISDNKNIRPLTAPAPLGRLPDLYARCLDPVPAARPSAYDLIAELEQWLDQEPQPRARCTRPAPDRAPADPDLRRQLCEWAAEYHRAGDGLEALFHLSLVGGAPPDESRERAREANQAGLARALVASLEDPALCRDFDHLARLALCEAIACLVGEPAPRRLGFSLTADAPEPAGAPDARLEDLRRAARGLCPEDRELVRLYFLDGWTEAELAERDGCSVTAVRRQLAQVRQRLRNARSSNRM